MATEPRRTAAPLALLAIVALAAALLLLASSSLPGLGPKPSDIHPSDWQWLLKTTAWKELVGRWLPQRSNWLGTKLPCRHLRRPPREVLWTLPACQNLSLKVLQWPSPWFGGNGVWSEGADTPYPFPPALHNYTRAVAAILGLSATLPPGTVPKNSHAAPPRGFTQPFCEGHGFTSRLSRSAEDYEEANLVLVEYPFWMLEHPGLAPPPLARTQASLFALVGESAEHYGDIMLPSFLGRFNVTLGSAPGWFDFPGKNGYLSAATELAKLGASKQERLVSRSGSWPEDRPLAAFMISNCWAPSPRLEYLAEVQRLLGDRVHSLGGCLKTHSISEDILVRHGAAGDKNNAGQFSGDWRAIKKEVFANYPFVFAFENANCYDSVTEKPFDALLAGSVPVYMGAPNIADYLPRNSFIDTRAFSGPAELVAHLIELAGNPVRYAAYHRWREESPESWPWMKASEQAYDACGLLARQFRLQCGEGG